MSAATGGDTTVGTPSSSSGDRLSAESLAAVDVLDFDTDDAAMKHLSLVLGRHLTLSSRNSKDENGIHRGVVEIDPGPGILTRHLLEQHPHLGLRGIYLNKAKFADAHARLFDDFPDRFSASQANFWGACALEEKADTVVDLEKEFFGKSLPYHDCSPTPSP